VSTAVTNLKNPALSRLKGSLKATVEYSQQREVYGALEEMRLVYARLSRKISSGGGLPTSVICASVKKLDSSGLEGMSRRELRALCGGLNHSCEKCTKRKIFEESSKLTIVLEKFKVAFLNGELKATSWFDLLFSYFSAVDKGASWEELRRILSDTYPAIVQNSGGSLPWMKILADNPEMLGTKPCSKVAREIIDGKTYRLDALRQVLKIPEASWFWQDLLLAQAESAAKLDDQKFTDMIPAIVSAVKPFSSLLKDAVIGICLSRYLLCQSRGAHELLKDFTIDNWGPPNLRVRQKYDTVAPEVRRMVQEWVARQDLEDFFTLLQEDKIADERRLKFWGKYIKQIEFHRILLGAEARRTMQADFVELRKRPSAGRLTGSTAENNAFVMQISGWVLIESSSKGNAVYGYRSSSLPFDIQATEVEISRFRKKDDADFRADHRDTNEGAWEEVLSKKLSRLSFLRHMKFCVTRNLRFPQQSSA
jgi:hypothetical protein